VNDSDTDTKVGLDNGQTHIKADELDERISRLKPDEVVFKVPSGGVSQVLPLDEDEYRMAKSLAGEGEAVAFGRFRLRRSRRKPSPIGH
jgi:hypothetical protein